MNQEIHKKIDVYAFAVMLFEIVSGESAWSGLSQEQIRSSVMDGQRPSLKEKIVKSTHPALIELLKQGWQPNPNDRPAFEQIKVRISENFSPEQRINDNTLSKSVTANTLHPLNK